jgi:ankyrin repeat protein
LALTFKSPTQSNIAVQLYDSEERVLAVDLLAQRKVVSDQLSETTLLIPIKDFPTTAHIILRRLYGEVSIQRLRLAELIQPADQTSQEAQTPAALLGEPSASDSTLNAKPSSPPKPAPPGAHLPGTAYQPLLNLSQGGSADSLSERDLRDLFLVLGLQGYDFNAVDFVRAAGEGRREVVELYLRAGMPINVQGRNRYTAIAEAATSGELRVIELLCEKGADPDIKTAGGNNALRMATFTPHLQAVRMLVDYGADLNSVGAYGKTPAQSLNHSRTANFDQVDATTLYLVKKGASPDIPDQFGNTLLHDIAAYGRYNLMAEVLPYSDNPNRANAHGMTPIMLAELDNSSRMVRTLESAGVPPWTPQLESLDDQLVFEVYKGHSRKISDLLDKGADPNALDHRQTAICFKAIDKRRLDILKLLHAHGADFDILDPYGRNALGRVHGEYHIRREAIVDYLLEVGLDPNYATDAMLRQKKPFWTPLMRAADSGNEERCMRLIEAGGDPTVKNLPKRTAAVIAERAGYIHLASKLRAAEEAHARSAQSARPGNL